MGSGVHTRKSKTMGGEEEVETVAIDLNTRSSAVPGGVKFVPVLSEIFEQTDSWLCPHFSGQGTSGCIRCLIPGECHIFRESPGWKNGLKKPASMLEIGLVLCSPYTMTAQKMLLTRPASPANHHNKRAKYMGS